MSNYALDNPSLGNAISASLHNVTRQMRTAMPGRVMSFDATRQTATIQPLIRMMMADGTAVDLPPLADVPVQFPEGGGFAFTFPLAAGDEGIVVIGDRCIDGWWQSGQPSAPLDYRMHDLSDGMFIPGINSRPKVIPSMATDAVVMRKFDGSAYVKIDKGGNIEADGTLFTVKCPAVFEQPVVMQNTQVVQGLFSFMAGLEGQAGGAGSTIMGGLDLVGGQLTHNGKDIGASHKHGGVQSGGSTSGGPV